MQFYPPLQATTTTPKSAPQKAIALSSCPADPDIKLGWILLSRQWISATQLESALLTQQQTPQKIGELLVEQSAISGEQLEQALKEQYWRRNGYWII